MQVGSVTNKMTMQDKDEDISSFVLRWQKYTRKETKKGRNYTNMEFLEHVYNQIHKTGYDETRKAMVKAIEYYHENGDMIKGYKKQYLDTTLFQKYCCLHYKADQDIKANNTEHGDNNKFLDACENEPDMEFHQIYQRRPYTRYPQKC